MTSIMLYVFNEYCDYRESYGKLMKEFDYFGSKKDASGNYYKEYLENTFIPLAIKGKIINRFADRCNHSIKNIDVQISDSTYMNILPFEFFWTDDKLYANVKIGDSLFKNSGSLIISIKRGNAIWNYKVSPLENYWVNPYFEINDSIP